MTRAPELPLPPSEYGVDFFDVAVRQRLGRGALGRPTTFYVKRVRRVAAPTLSAETHAGIVTLPGEERERTISRLGVRIHAAATTLAPRAHRRGAEHAV